MNTTKALRDLWRNNPGWPKGARDCFRKTLDDVDELVTVLREFATHAECPSCGGYPDADEPLRIASGEWGDRGHHADCKLVQLVLVQG